MTSIVSYDGVDVLVETGTLNDGADLFQVQSPQYKAVKLAGFVEIGGNYCAEELFRAADSFENRGNVSSRFL